MAGKEFIAVYMMANAANTVLYIGVTSHLLKRVYEHRTHAVDGFTKQYHCTKLVWFEPHETMESAIRREKRLKKYTRAQKVLLIEKTNPRWQDGWEQITQ